MKPAALAGLATGVAIPAYGVYRRYRREMNAARARLAAVDRHVISTRWGAVEYAERGYGDPVLVVHGIFHNCVGGLFSVRDFSDRRFIAPSRFGYLGSSMPPHATPAHQADAFATLLDALDIGQVDVICESAGATSALQLALRHPERVKHLGVLVGNLPGSPTAVVQPSVARLFNRQLPLWVLRTVAPSMMVRLVAGLPKGFALSTENARFVTEFIDSLFPVSPDGVDFDAFVSNAAVNDYSLEGIRVPTLIVHTKDDQLASHDASQRAAKRIPGARFVSRIGRAPDDRPNEDRPRRARQVLCGDTESRRRASGELREPQTLASSFPGRPPSQHRSRGRVEEGAYGKHDDNFLQ